MFAQILAAGGDTGIDTHWLAIALDDLQARLLAGEDQVDLMEDLITLAVVPNLGVDAQKLIDYADEHLSAEAAAAANAVVAPDDPPRRAQDDVGHSGCRHEAGQPGGAPFLCRPAERRELRRGPCVHEHRGIAGLSGRLALPAVAHAPGGGQQPALPELRVLPQAVGRKRCPRRP
jgi:hypothetical protein